LNEVFICGFGISKRQGGPSENIMEIPGGGGKSCQALWNGKSWGVGAQTGKNPPWGVWIFSGTTQYQAVLTEQAWSIKDLLWLSGKYF